MGRYVVGLSNRSNEETVGNKGKQLSNLLAYGLRVPPTWACTWDAFDAYQTKGEEILAELKEELVEALPPDGCYAVRSSANIEDSQMHSFAGQFLSVLNVQGIDGILIAIRSVWDSAGTGTSRQYTNQVGLGQAEIHMAVLIQEMVPQVVSGVVFSHNPITGQDEVILEAVNGSGEQLLQGGMTPYRWKQQRGKKWIDLPENPPFDQTIAQDIVDQTRTLAKITGRKLDLEWIYNGRDVFWVQMRDITMIEDVPVYSNRLAREMLPGMVKPLAWSFSIPCKTIVWKRFLIETIGSNDFNLDTLTRPFYYRMYINMTMMAHCLHLLGFPEDMLDSVMGVGGNQDKMPRFRPSLRMLSFAPRYIAFIFDKMNFSRRLDPAVKTLLGKYQAFEKLDLSTLSDEDLLLQLEGLKSILTDTGYYVAIERMVMSGYLMAFRKQLKQNQIDPDSIDLKAGLDETRQYDPKFDLANLNRRFFELPDPVRARAVQCPLEEARRVPELSTFFLEFDAFLTKFWYLSDNGNDISAPTWREKPEVIFRLVTMPPAPAARQVGKSFDTLRLAWWKKTMLGIVYRQARKYQFYREQLTTLFEMGHVLGRKFFLEIGVRLAGKDQLLSKDDIFYLDLDEIKLLLQRNDRDQKSVDLVSQRKQEIELCRKITPPEVVYGEVAPPIYKGVENRLKGVPTSKGYYTGRVKVIHGLEEFTKMEDGAILIMPHSDVGWTPLIMKAGGIVSESGGMLSHSSIVAREYGIPAVVAVPNATMIRDGSLATIDGYQGEVVLHEEQELEEERN